MIVADTSVWIDYVKGIDASHTNILDHELIYYTTKNKCIEFYGISERKKFINDI